jgi:hypothetical protein
MKLLTNNLSSFLLLNINLIIINKLFLFYINVNLLLIIISNKYSTNN